jgi:hypothetical protein
VAVPPHDAFPNNFIGDLVPTERGWVVVPPTCCPVGHAYSDRGWSVSSVLVYLQRQAHGVAMQVRRSPVRAAARSDCRIRDRGPTSMWEDEQEHTPDS